MIVHIDIMWTSTNDISMLFICHFPLISEVSNFQLNSCTLIRWECVCVCEVEIHVAVARLYDVKRVRIGLVQIGYWSGSNVRACAFGDREEWSGAWHETTSARRSAGAVATCLGECTYVRVGIGLRGKRSPIIIVLCLQQYEDRACTLQPGGNSRLPAGRSNEPA